MITLLVALLAVQIQPTPSTPPAPGAPPAAAAPRRPAPTSVNVEVRVTDRSGNPAPGARVIAEGPSTRNAVADVGGLVTFRTLALGTYRFRAEGDEFISLEKEVTLRGGTMPPIEFALSRAPEPPPAAVPLPPPPAPVVAQAPPILPGEARVVSLLDVAERSLGGKEPVLTVPIGCSGLSRAQLLVVRDSLQATAQSESDDMLYVIAGEASITLAGKTQAIESGWFSVVPRGATRTLTRKGKNPVILLSIVGGPPCSVPAP